MPEPKPRPPRSEAAREASRRNGARSRGPKTAQGKAVSARNALKHGLRARQSAAPESLPEWIARAAATFTAALGPTTIINGEKLEELVFSFMLIEQAEQHIAAEIGRLHDHQRANPGPLTLADLDLLGKLLSYRRRFYGTRNRCFTKLRPT
jgi:hypothetical protein